MRKLRILAIATLTGVTTLSSSTSVNATPASIPSEISQFQDGEYVVEWNDENFGDLRIYPAPDRQTKSTSQEARELGEEFLREYRRAANQNQSNLVFLATDYCTYSPDRWRNANFKAACAAHDACYSSTSRTNRADCDSNLRRNLRSACSFAYAPNTSNRSRCYGVAQTYYLAVRSFGQSHYNGRGLNN